MIAGILGGIGLFLLGMVLLTDGLKAAAGDALRDALRRLTGGPWRALLSGVGITAIVQSSSATVLTTIGFVSAGLLTFPQAIGVVFGASLGTTSTGWIVSVLGLKLSVGAVALPLVGVGALLRLLVRGRGASIGLALAGFGLIFVGIDVLQRGMADLSTRLDPAAFPGHTLAGRLLLVGVGVMMTVVMQSSSAAVAATLTALHTGTIGLAQGAALVIGASLGTTVTAMLASVGGSVPARRTALAHIMFNAVAAVFAFVLLPVFVPVASRAVAAGTDPAIALAAFHTAFNVLGVLLLMPAVALVAQTITRLVPEAGPVLTRHLDPSVAQVPAVAVETARLAVIDTAAALLHLLPGGPARPGRMPPASVVLQQADEALGAVRRFLAGVRAPPDAPHAVRSHQSVLHAIDHLDRLIETLRDAPPATVELEPAAARLRDRARPRLAACAAWLAAPQSSAPVDALRALAEEGAAVRRAQRRELIDRAVTEGLDPDAVLLRLEVMRWLDRAIYHTWRAVAHLSGAAAAEARVEVFADAG
jgi:phosphate:Na+ symporter